ncbi:hypothetical protein HYALB_00003689 [Hymenoscyphus albidus]|uniref:HAD-superfamily phosphatase n=1 Tax=Hymenoscyphus albidus TaxID=595503 RepID=A0A9N9LLX5_9HELO|nr:hypothetical protein HYALB_00003689 [Hymenoscyphus albidus]
MDMSSFNISATLSLFRLVTRPNLCLPQSTFATFNDLPIPLDKAFEGKYKNVDIRAVVLDKDNCFARPHENGIFEGYEKHFAHLEKTYPNRKLLIVSNTAGSSSDPTLSLSAAVVESTGVHVLPHSRKKPGCGGEIMEYFRKYPETGVTRPEHVVVIGDRLTTDVMLANTMGSYSCFLKDGVLGAQKLSFLAKMEQRFANFILRRGYVAPDPSSPF